MFNRLTLLLLLVLGLCAQTPPTFTFPYAVTYNVITGTCNGGSCTGSNSALAGITPLATCNGSSSDQSAFVAIETPMANWYAANPGGNFIVTSGSSSNVCVFGPIDFNGIPNIEFLNFGFSDGNNGEGAGFLGTTQALFFDNNHSARLSTVSAGATSVTITGGPTGQSVSTIAALWSGCSSGSPCVALMCGVDLQGFGWPPNCGFHEHVQVTGVNASTGIVTLAAPLIHGYKSTWPNYSTADDLGYDLAGPATLYYLNPNWAGVLQFVNSSLSLTYETEVGQRIAILNNVSITTAGGEDCPYPSTNEQFWFVNSSASGCQMEADKDVDAEYFINSTFNIIHQSSSINTMYASGSTFGLYGSPRVFQGSNNTINPFIFGTSPYGAAASVQCANCAVTAGVSGFPDINLDKGCLNTNEIGVNNTYTISLGVIAIPLSCGAPGWAVPDSGTWHFFSGFEQNEGAYFQVTDLTADSSNTYVHTTLSGGWPGIPPDISNSHPNAIYISTHPAPSITMSCAAGSSADALDLCAQTPGLPYATTSSRIIAGSQLTTSLVEFGKLWGTPKIMTFNVTTPYTGVQSSLTMESFFDVNENSNTQANWEPTVNWKTAGTRQFINPQSGFQTGDTNTAIPGGFPLWLTFGYDLSVSTNIQSECTSNPSVCPSVTITIQTDQGIGSGGTSSYNSSQGGGVTRQ